MEAELPEEAKQEEETPTLTLSERLLEQDLIYLMDPSRVVNTEKGLVALPDETKPEQRQLNERQDQVLRRLRDHEKLPFAQARVIAARNYRNLKGGNTKQSRGEIKPELTTLGPAPEGLEIPAPSSVLRQGLYGSYGSFGYHSYYHSPMHLLANGEDPVEIYGEFTSEVVPTIDFPNRASFPTGESLGDFVARWTGFIKLDQRTRLELWFGTDLGGSVLIDGQPVIINDQFSWYEENVAIVELTPGYHHLVVEYIEEQQDEDPNRNAAARLRYLPDGANKPVPLPEEWLYLPLEVQEKAPHIASVTPASAQVGDVITLRGSNLGASEAAKQIASEHGIGVASRMEGMPKVKLSGVDCELLAYAKDELSVRIPVGADDGELSVEVSGYPSNKVSVEITNRFGLVASVWDISNDAFDYAAMDARAPDAVMLLEDPFPLTRDKIPGFAGKTIALRLEGEILAFPADEESKLILRSESLSFRAQRKDEGWIHHDSEKQKLVLVWGQSRRRTEEGIFMDDVRGIAIAVVTEMRARKSPDGGMEHERVPHRADGMTIDVLMPPSDASEVSLVQGTYMPGRSDVGPAPRTKGLEASTIFCVPLERRAFFLPAYLPPQPPRIFSDLFMPQSGAALPDLSVEKPEDIALAQRTPARVGEDLLIWVSDGDPDDPPLTVSVDGIAADIRPLEVEDYPIRSLRYADQGKEPWTLFEAWLVTIPDGCAEGILRASRGPAPSAPLLLDLRNRGVIGYYYDYSAELNALPNFASASPVMRRLDRALRFENAGDFDLPMAAERFACEWYGSLRIPEGMGGEWTFIVQSDDGCRFSLNGASVVELDKLRAPGESVGKVTLLEGWHDLHLEFFENTGVENCVVWWLPPGVDDLSARELIPRKHLSTEYSLGLPARAPLGWEEDR